MVNNLWLNFPVKDLKRSITFYETIGFKRNLGPGNTETSACFVVGDNQVVLMLFLEPAFCGFSAAQVADTTNHAEILVSIGAASKEQVDDFAARAEQGGGKVFSKPNGFAAGMYGCGLQDPDGHRWNALYLGR